MAPGLWKPVKWLMIKACEPAWLFWGDGNPGISLSQSMIRNLCQNVELQQDQRKKNEYLILHSVGYIHADFCTRKWMWSNRLHTKRTQTASLPVRFKNPKEPAYLLFSTHAPQAQASHLQMADLNSSLNNWTGINDNSDLCKVHLKEQLVKLTTTDHTWCSKFCLNLIIAFKKILSPNNVYNGY